ncbi:MAG: hypothetical protein IJR46_07295 [Neisseriaceae bacterium]|nr:hypothetical protein [Neisseriaceae bacterium]
MKNMQRSLLTIALTTVFSAMAYGDTDTSEVSGSLKEKNHHQQMQEKMQNMSPEERKKMREEMQKRRNKTQAATVNPNDATKIEDITVKATRNIAPAERYQNKISRRQIEMKSQGNGDIGSILRSLPNV